MPPSFSISITDLGSQPSAHTGSFDGSELPYIPPGPVISVNWQIRMGVQSASPGDHCASAPDFIVGSFSTFLWCTPLFE